MNPKEFESLIQTLWNAYSYINKASVNEVRMEDDGRIMGFDGFRQALIDFDNLK